MLHPCVINKPRISVELETAARWNGFLRSKCFDDFCVRGRKLPGWESKLRLLLRSLSFCELLTFDKISLARVVMLKPMALIHNCSVSNWLSLLSDILSNLEEEYFTGFWQGLTWKACIDVIITLRVFVCTILPGKQWRIVQICFDPQSLHFLSWKFMDQ